MPVYRLIDEIVFPPPDHAGPDGLLAVGGDLSSERLLLAYRLGIFPWYSEGQPILWWSPDPRFVLELNEFHVSRRLRQLLKKGVFKVTFDKAFESVIQACASVPREGQDGTWITPEMIEAVVSKLLERMQPEIMEVVNREVLRPAIEAMVRRVMEKS